MRISRAFTLAILFTTTCLAQNTTMRCTCPGENADCARPVCVAVPVPNATTPTTTPRMGVPAPQVWQRGPASFPRSTPVEPVPIPDSSPATASPSPSIRAPLSDPLLDSQTADEHAIAGKLSDAMRALDSSSGIPDMRTLDAGAAAGPVPLRLPELGDTPNLGNCYMQADAPRIADLRAKLEAYRSALSASSSALADVTADSDAGDNIEQAQAVLGVMEVVKGTADATAAIIGAGFGKPGELFQYGYGFLTNAAPLFFSDSGAETATNGSSAVDNLWHFVQASKQPEDRSPAKKALDTLDFRRSLLEAGKQIGAGIYDFTQRQAEADRLRAINAGMSNMIANRQSDLLQKISGIETELSTLTQCPPANPRQ
jgi:hypothetical protein